MIHEGFDHDRELDKQQQASFEPNEFIYCLQRVFRSRDERDDEEEPESESE